MTTHRPTPPAVRTALLHDDASPGCSRTGLSACALPQLATAAVALCVALTALALGGCVENPLQGLQAAEPADTVVKMDFMHRPLPELPLPNDLATIHDAAADTKRRINASMVAPTAFERRTRRRIDALDGWGVYTPITIPMTGLIDLQGVLNAHHGDDYAFADDLVYVVDITPGSPTYGKPHPLDLGNGNFPVHLEKLDHYWAADPRRDTISALFDEHDEDTNGNGKLDPGEDTDLDGVLDKPNYLPGISRSDTGDDLVKRADALMSFYERETNTLILRPLVPLRERTTYAVVVTRRMKDAKGKPVGSPFPWVHHLGQTDALSALPDVLSAGASTFGNLAMADVAFAWTFSTGSVTSDIVAVREGLYGYGVQRHLNEAFPPNLELKRLHDDKPSKKYESVWTLSGETFATVAQLVAQGGIVSLGGPEQQQRFKESLKYVNYHVFGTYKTPRLYPLTDAEGHFLDYNDQVWPSDLAKNKAEAYAEDVTFWMSTPRKEATKDGKPRGVVILGHGYTGSKTEMFSFHSFFNQMGLVVVAIDSASHGFTLGEKDRKTLNEVFGLLGLGKLADALTSNRSRDQNLDGEEDSGADFWTAYAFHTRDVVRQTAVDYMQLVRVLRSWDGKKLWKHDINGNGVEDDVAGDLDGDGTVDVGGPDMPITMMGASLGGIMAAVVGGLEPEIDAVLPIAGGGGLTDVGIRSLQGGVKEAMTLRVMGPLYVGKPSKEGVVTIQTVVPDTNNTARVPVASLDKATASQLSVGDTVRVDNLDNGEYDCARLIADAGCVAQCQGDKACESTCWSFRLHIASDVIPAQRQRHSIAFYKGDAFVVGERDEVAQKACKLKDGATPVHTVDKFGVDVKFHFQSAPLDFKAGDALSPLAEGLGLHRARPEFRRFIGFAQLILDPGDPAVYAQHFTSGEISYSDGSTVSTRALVLNTVGDMNVPVSTGAAIGRAAGLLDYTTPVADWGGRTVNQTLIDTKVLQAVDTIPHFVDSAGKGVLFDPEDLSGSATAADKLPTKGVKVAYAQPMARGKDGYEVPRLSPPLHTHAVTKDRAGGMSGTFFPYVRPEGQHGFWQPGEHTDYLIKACKADAKAKGTDESECNKGSYFDHGALLWNALGRYLATRGTEFSLEPCMITFSCADVLPAPKARK